MSVEPPAFALEKLRGVDRFLDAAPGLPERLSNFARHESRELLFPFAKERTELSDDLSAHRRGRRAPGLEGLTRRTARGIHFFPSARGRNGNDVAVFGGVSALERAEAPFGLSFSSDARLDGMRGHRRRI